MPSLAELQQIFHDCVRTREMRPFSKHLGPCDGISAEDRLRVYQANVFISLKDVLASTFARVHSLVGEDCFYTLAFQFIAKHPPESGCLLEYGQALPDFIEQIPQMKNWPYLGDVARLDWMLNEAYYAADADSLDATVIQALPPEFLPKVTVQFPPSTAFLQSKFPLQQIWEVALEKSTEFVDWRAGHGHVMVTRPAMEVEVFWLEPESYAFLNALFLQCTLETAYEKAAQINSNFDLQAMLLICLRQNYFCQIITNN